MISVHAKSVEVSTIGLWDGISGTSTLGDGATTTYGQTFRVSDSVPVLDSFTFFLDDREELLEIIEFAGHLMEWSPSEAHPIGSPLFSTSPIQTTNNNGSDGMERVTLSTGGLTLNPTKQYVAFLDVTLFLDGVNDGAVMGTLPLGVDAYTDGFFTIVNAPGNDFSLLTATGWNAFDGIGSSHRDTAFEAVFSSPVPLPVAVWLFGFALVLLGLVR